MRTFVVLSLAFTLVRHMFGAGRTFRPVPEAMPGPRISLISIAAFVILVHGGGVPSIEFDVWRVIAGAAALVLALSLFEWAKRSIRGQFFSYVYSGDEPKFVWTRGPYAYVRNPFYDSYLITYAGALIMMPDLTILAVFLVMLWFFWSAARFEERKFARSPLASEYETYMKRTGRFIPRLMRREATA